MLKKLLYKNLAIAIVAQLSYSSCSNSDNANSNANEILDSAAAAIPGIDFDGLLKDVPHPTNVPQLLERSGAEFAPDLVNNNKDVSLYTESESKSALNLGIYASDLAYLATYGKNKESLEYFKICKALSDKLSISEGFDAALVEKFESSLTNKDSMLYLIENSSVKIREFLNSSQRHSIQSNVMVGSFIEGLYISTNLVKSVAPDLPEDARNTLLVELTRAILDQRTTLEKLLAYLDKAASQDPALNELVQQLKPLETEFSKFDVENDIKNNKGSLVLKSESLKEITRITEQVRSAFIK